MLEPRPQEVVCSKCGGLGPFTVDRSTKSGYRGQCIHCDKARLDSDESRYIYLKSAAKKRRIKCSLTFEEYKHIVCSRRCHYCGDNLPRRGYGLDRIESNLGYIIGNVVPCCTDCNTAKGRMTWRSFESWIDNVTDWRSVKQWHPAVEAGWLN